MRKGNIDRGNIKITSNQKKKHYTQMSENELNFLKIEIEKIEHIKPSWHLDNKSHVGYHIEDVWKVINDTDIKNRIIEFNITPKRGILDRRVLLRSKEIYSVEIDNNQIDCNLCFVISLRSHEIITIYYNKCDDFHDTIDWRRYDENLKII